MHKSFTFRDKYLPWGLKQLVLFYAKASSVAKISSCQVHVYAIVRGFTESIY